VISGGFEIIIEEYNINEMEAMNLAMKMHNESNNPSELGEITMVEKLTRKSNPTGKFSFIHTKHLIDKNTFPGQYTTIE
jgi:hypothetical protein